MFHQVRHLTLTRPLLSTSQAKTNSSNKLLVPIHLLKILYRLLVSHQSQQLKHKTITLSQMRAKLRQALDRIIS